MVFPASFSFSWSVPTESFVLDFLTPYVVTVAMQCAVTGLPCSHCPENPGSTGYILRGYDH